MGWRPSRCWQEQGSCKKPSLARENRGWCRGGEWGEARGCVGTGQSGAFAKAKEAAGSSEGAGREARELRQQDLICCRKLPAPTGQGVKGQGWEGAGEEAAARPRTPASGLKGWGVGWGGKVVLPAGPA